MIELTEGQLDSLAEKFDARINEGFPSAIGYAGQPVDFKQRVRAAIKIVVDGAVDIQEKRERGEIKDQYTRPKSKGLLDNGTPSLNTLADGMQLASRTAAQHEDSAISTYVSTIGNWLIAKGEDLRQYGLERVTKTTSLTNITVTYKVTKLKELQDGKGKK